MLVVANCWGCAFSTPCRKHQIEIVVLCTTRRSCQQQELELDLECYLVIIAISTLLAGWKEMKMIVIKIDTINKLNDCILHWCVSIYIHKMLRDNWVGHCRSEMIAAAKLMKQFDKKQHCCYIRIELKCDYEFLGIFLHWNIETFLQSKSPSRNCAFIMSASCLTIE